jgi:hypothetical protein
MVHALSIWLLVAGFFGAGLFNAIGTPGTQSDFARWGHPRWWNILTGGLEVMSAVLIALPVSRIVWPRAWGGNHCGCGFDRSTSPRFFAPCAT